MCSEELEETTNAEAAAVEAEDFERAASLSAKADAAKAHLAELDQALRAADAACTQAVSNWWRFCFRLHPATLQLACADTSACRASDMEWRQHVWNACIGDANGKESIPR